jgi:hypothetical protein
MILKPTQEWEPKNRRYPNKCQNNTERNKADWPMRGEFPDFTI